MSKSFFPISFDSSTTSNFGECIPQFCHEVVADSHVNIDLRSAVRFAPLSLPTFGKAYLHSYAFYHKFCDLWKPYNEFISQTPYSNGSGTTYIPTSVPSVPLSYLWMIVLAHSSFTVWDVNSNVIASGVGSPVSVANYSVNPRSLDSVQADQLNLGLVATLSRLVSSLPDVDLGPLYGYLADPSRKSNLIYGLDDAPPSRCVPASDDDAIFPAGADFMVSFDGLFSYFRLPDGSLSPLNFTPGSSVLYCFKLNNSGKLLRKILMGLGYHLKRFGYSDFSAGMSAQTVSVLPLFAFYKSYFSTFAPKRFVKYDQTFFGRVMTAIENTGSSFVDTVFTDTVFSTGSPLSGMIDDLLSCFYTEDTDYYSSQIIGLANDFGGSLMQQYLGVNKSGSPEVSSLSDNPTQGNVPAIDLAASPMKHSQAQQNVMARLTNFVNRRSLLGGKIADLLESVFGIPKKDVFDDDNPYIGSNVVDVDFSDVFSTSETAEGSLGEYAGKAIGVGSSNDLSVDCPSPGYILVFNALVPRTQKVQGLNPMLFHVKPSDFYNPQFDGLTLLPTNKLTAYCIDSLSDRFNVDGLRSFGNQSLFAEYKTRTQGILNGDLSLMSTKSSYDSFTMDQTFAHYVAQDPQETSGTVVFSVIGPNTSSLSAGTMWRYIGRWLWLGNFDRIFVNTRQFYTTVFPGITQSGFSWSSRDVSVIDDNLVVHNVVDLKINAPMLPLEDSYMTRDLEDLGNSSGFRAQGE